eukprot:TRINITY_DN9434_c0_g1_i1.p1 TRINITY_DN9434_c0_g1~~TRINITY_DN9434_c0_g1_i1.p1  ORF type:complete len:146 (-),score=30.56 TRINITY_DN9434_c0_g1_i1:45-482(-)
MRSPESHPSHGKEDDVSYNQQNEEVTGASPWMRTWKRGGDWTMAGMRERFQRANTHFEKYPYVWYAYGLVFGTLTVFMANSWRNLRLRERELIQIQKEMRERLAIVAKEAESQRAVSVARSAAPSHVEQGDTVTGVIAEQQRAAV